MSRHQAQKAARGRTTVAEEMPAAYKDVAGVVGVRPASAPDRAGSAAR